jgi:hypothetical protein
MDKNAKLSRIHRILAIAYAVGGLLLLFLTLTAPRGAGWAVAAFGGALGTISIIVLHCFAARGAREGTNWGRTLSRIIGIVLFIGLPLGSIPGAYILMQTGKRWESGVLLNLEDKHGQNGGRQLR